MKKNNKNKKSLLLVFAVLFATVATGALVSTTYAKYIASLGEKESTATVAKWAFETDNASTTLSFALDKTYNKSTLVAGKIAPGTSGTFTINLSNANSEVGVDYTIVFEGENLPTNLKLYSNESHTQELTENESTGKKQITGSLAPNATATTDVKVYWQWPYETELEDVLTTTDVTDISISTGDEYDTTDGTSASESAKITATIYGVQTTPAE